MPFIKEYKYKAGAILENKAYENLTNELQDLYRDKVDELCDIIQRDHPDGYTEIHADFKGPYYILYYRKSGDMAWLNCRFSFLKNRLNKLSKSLRSKGVEVLFREFSLNGEIIYEGHLLDRSKSKNFDDPY